MHQDAHLVVVNNAEKLAAIKNYLFQSESLLLHVFRTLCESIEVFLIRILPILSPAPMPA